MPANCHSMVELITWAYQRACGPVSPLRGPSRPGGATRGRKSAQICAPPLPDASPPPQAKPLQPHPAPPGTPPSWAAAPPTSTPHPPHPPSLRHPGRGGPRAAWRAAGVARVGGDAGGGRRATPARACVPGPCRAAVPRSGRPSPAPHPPAHPPTRPSARPPARPLIRPPAGPAVCPSAHLSARPARPASRSPAPAFPPRSAVLLGGPSADAPPHHKHPRSHPWPPASSPVDPPTWPPARAAHRPRHTRQPCCWSLLRCVAVRPPFPPPPPSSLPLRPVPSSFLLPSSPSGFSLYVHVCLGASHASSSGGASPPWPPGGHRCRGRSTGRPCVWPRRR